MPNQPAQARGKWSRWFRPSLGDCLVIAVLLWPIVMTVIGADAGLLLDSATGCHIRTGDYIIEHASVPHVDPFSFTKNGQVWFAWEWLADLLFARIFGIWGMQGFVVICALLIAATAYCVVRHSLWGGADAFTTLVLFQFWVGASSIHFLARPHLFTLLFLTLSFWLIDSDRRRRTPRLWLLVPLTVLWVNLHGGFVALVVSLVIVAIGSAVEALLSSAEASRLAWRNAMRYSLVAGSCVASSAINPYGLAEHRHLISYLSADWIKDLVEEFQSPRFQANGMLYFEVLLIVGILVAARLAVKGNRVRLAGAGVGPCFAHFGETHSGFRDRLSPSRGTRVDCSPGSLDRVRNMDISRKGISVLGVRPCAGLAASKLVGCRSRFCAAGVPDRMPIVLRFRKPNFRYRLLSGMPV